MNERKKINEILIEEIENFLFYNKMSVDEFADFFGLRTHKLRNWKNSKGHANPVLPDLWRIESVQRSEKANILNYKINVFRIVSGYKTTLDYLQIAKENEQLREIIRDLQLEILKIKQSSSE